MSVLEFYVCVVFLPFLILGQDAVLQPPAAPPATTTIPPTNEIDYKKLFDEVHAQRQILDSITRTLNPVAEALRKLDSASAKSEETFRTISSLRENIRKIETLVEQVPQKVAEVEASTSKQDEFHTSLTSKLNSLQTTLTSKQQTSLDDLQSRLATISEHTKGLEQLNKVQKNSAKQTELLEKLLSNQETILQNQNKIIVKLAKNWSDTVELYYWKFLNATHEVTQFFSDAISGKKGTAGASLKKTTSALLNQAGALAAKVSSQGQDYVVKFHGELSSYLKQAGIPEPYHVYAATSILTLPLSLFALLIVTVTFKMLRILGSIIFYPCYCCFRRRSRPTEDVESKKRKSSEVATTTTTQPPGKKQNTARK